MKPEIVYVRESDGTVMLTKDELDSLIVRAYEAGKEDAQGKITQSGVWHPTWSDRTDAPTKWKTDVWCGTGANGVTSADVAKTYTGELVG